MIDTTCRHCGVTFKTWPNRLRRGEGRYCSRSCIGKAHPAKNPTGEAHRLWKGGRQATVARQAAKRLGDRTKDRARAAVYDAVRRGRMVRQPCRVCGAEKSEAHHEDYSKPLDVMWLCRKHHKEADRRLGVATGDFGT